MQKDKYVKLKESELIQFEGSNVGVNLDNDQEISFVRLEDAEKVLGNSSLEDRARYFAVSFPESQLFMSDYSDQLFLINDSSGRKAFGNSAYFAEVNLYNKVRSDFERGIEKSSDSFLSR